LNAQWLNTGIDKAVSLNLMPVEFTDKAGNKSELVTEFAAAVWLQYCANMVRFPLAVVISQ